MGACLSRPPRGATVLNDGDVTDLLPGLTFPTIEGGADLRRRVQADGPRRPRVAAGERAHLRLLSFLDAAESLFNMVYY